MQRFRHGAPRLAIELGIAVVPIAIVGAYQAMPKGRWWPRVGRAGRDHALRRRCSTRRQGETHQALSMRMQQAVTQLFDEDRTDWFQARSGAQRGETPSLAGPVGASWRRTWEGSRPVPRSGRPRTWE